MKVTAFGGWRGMRHQIFRGLAGLCVGMMLVACGGGGGGSDTASNGDGTSGGGGGGGSGGARAKWTYLVYMAAENNLSDMATFNVNQMKAAQSSNDVRVVVQLDQSTSETPGASATTLRGSVSNHETHFATLGKNVDMSDKQTLSDFIKWGKQNYPADHYAVVLWSHGGGWRADKVTRGALQDSSANGKIMSIKDIAWALQDAGGVDLVNFDACLMAMYEVAYELRGAAKVMVASEENIPGTGNPYDKVINRLVADPAQDAVTLGKGIAKDYIDFYTADNRSSVTISAIDLSKIDALHTSIKALAKTMIQNLADERVHIQPARDASTSYGYPANHDLIGFVKGLAQSAGVQALRDQANGVATAAQAAVLANHVLKVNGDLPVTGSSGLAIYLPSINNVTQSELTQYKTFASSNTVPAGEQSWSDFVNALITGGGGSTQDTTTGTFAYSIEWDNPDVDLDLRVNEPQGNWAGPVYGPTSINGFSSPDSWESGETRETYTANAQLEKGAYDVFVRFAGCSKDRTTCGSTNVRVYRYDPTNGDTAPQLIATRAMSATPALQLPQSATFNDFIAAIKTNAYGNWLYAQRTMRALVESSKPQLSFPKPRDKALPQQVDK